MSAEPTHEKFHGIHPRKGNNVHDRLKHDREPARLGIVQNMHAIYCGMIPINEEPATTTDASNSVTI